MSRKTERTEQEQEYLVRLGKNIRNIRKQKGYSQEEFAHMAGFSRSYFTEIETGKRNISVLNLFRIAEKLDVTPAELI